MITTQRLILRRLKETDKEAIFAYRSDPKVSLYQEWAPESLGEVEEFIRRTSAHHISPPDIWFQLGITLEASGELIGDTGLHYFSGMPQQAEIGISLAPSHQGKGYATEALNAILHYLFVTLEKHRVFTSTDPRNTRAVALLERCGLRREAHFRQSLHLKGEWVDDLIYAMLKEEWITGKMNR